jgi:hypothetical protein
MERQAREGNTELVRGMGLGRQALRKVSQDYFGRGRSGEKSENGKMGNAGGTRGETGGVGEKGKIG